MCGGAVSKERHRTTTMVKTLLVKITAALMHVIDYQDVERRRQVCGTVHKPIQPYKDRLNTVWVFLANTAFLSDIGTN